MKARKPTEEGCGCTHDGHTWLTECEACRAEHAELHQRAQADRFAASATEKQS